MKTYFIMAVYCSAAFMISSCESAPSEFDVAELAVTHHDLAALKASIAANPSIVTQGSGFDGGTLLHQALTNTPSFDCAEFLLSQGADPNQPDITGEYPIHVICRYNGDVKCLKLLLDHGADPSIDWKKGGMTSVELAKKWNFEDAALMLERALSKP